MISMKHSEWTLPEDIIAFQIQYVADSENWSSPGAQGPKHPADSSWSIPHPNYSWGIPIGHGQIPYVIQLDPSLRPRSFTFCRGSCAWQQFSWGTWRLISGLGASSVFGLTHFTFFWPTSWHTDRRSFVGPQAWSVMHKFQKRSVWRFGQFFFSHS